MRQSLEKFITSLEASNRSKHTIRAYRSELEAFIEAIGSVENMTRYSLRGFLAADMGKSPATRRRRIAAVRSFLQFMRIEGEASDQTVRVVMRFQKPKLYDTLPFVPTAEEVRTLLNGDIPTAFPERDRLILELLYGSGLRVSEAAGIDTRDIDAVQRQILIHGKGDKDRLVPFGIPAANAFAEYVKARAKRLRDLHMSTDALFFGVRGPGDEAITPRAVTRMLRDVCRTRGLRPIRPHALRHACATHMLDNGAPIEIIAKLLGHTNLETTARYARVSTTLMQKSYSASHPHAQGLAEKIDSALTGFRRKLSAAVMGKGPQPETEKVPKLCKYDA